MQTDNNIDKLFQSRIGDYESKTSFDEDLLWTNINKAQSSSFTHFLRNQSFYIGCIAVAAFVSAAAIIIFQHQKIEQLQNTLNSQTQVKITPKESNHIDGPITVEPEVKNNIQSSSIISSKEAKGTVESRPITANKTVINSQSIQKNSTKITTVNKDIEQNTNSNKRGDSLIQNTNHIESKLTENTQVAPLQNTVKKITVVKKQIIQKDSVVKVKRVR